MSEAVTLSTYGWQPPPPWQHNVATQALSRRDHWPHALLITGRQGIGKRMLALEFARALLCETPDAGGGACGACPGCVYVAQGTHPDLRVIGPYVFDDDGNATPVDSIAIDRIRELTEFTHLSAHRGRAKVGVIAPAEAMNAAAANALLKTLEEPPEQTYLLLVSHQPARLPATIASRCLRLAAPEPDAASATAWLSARGVDRAELVLAQAGGSPLLAIDLAGASLQQQRNSLLDELARPERLSPVAIGAQIDAEPRDERKARLGETLYWLLTWTADLATVAAGASPRFHPDRREALSRLASRVARGPLFRYYRTLLQQRSLLAHPLQPRLVAEALLFEYRTLFARG
jgi:DNA polymerase III subunit delta'